MSLANPSYFKQLSLKFKFFLGSLFYLTYAPKAYLYSRSRDRLEQQIPLPPITDTFEQPGKLVRAESNDRGAQFYFEQAELEVSFLTPDFVRLTWQPGLLPIPYAIHQHDWAEVSTRCEQTEAGWTVTSERLQVSVAIDGSVTFSDSSGRVLREEMPPKHPGEGWSHQVKLRPEEHIYGLGERSAPLNLRTLKPVNKKDERTQQEDTTLEPPSYRMWNYDAAGMYGVGSDPMYLCIPLQMSLHQEGCYLVFYENSFDATFQYEDVATISFEGGALRYYLTAGTPAQNIERYTELTGRSPIPPKWALGYHQSRWGYRTEAAVMETVQKFEELDLPLSAVHMDIDVQVGYRAFTIDPERFPNTQEFMRSLLDKGVRFITILNPGVKYSRDSNLFLEGQLLNLFCRRQDGELVVAPVWPGWCVFPDFTNPKARHWWSRQYEYLLDVGVAGFWHDMNEPAAFIAWGDRSLPPRATLHNMEGRGGDHREAHNVYGYLQAKAAYESLGGYRPHLRPFIVSRAGWAGLQRYSWTWTGDIECTWDCLKITISTVLNLGLSGIPYSGPDIGGFQGNPSAELYLRWFQLATFVTFYRSHCSNNVEYRAPWTYGEPYLGILRQFLKLRYKLLPYFYTLSWESNQKGYPLLRPLFWADSTDADLWAIDDAFLLGDNLLICPALAEGERERSATLPQGRWYHFWDDRAIEGGTRVMLPAPLEQIPVLVKAGTVLPMEEKKQMTLHLYPPTAGSSDSVLYTDAGDGYGEFRCDRFSLIRSENSLELVRQGEGEFPFPYDRWRIQVHGMTVQEVQINGESVSHQENELECDSYFQHVRFNGIFQEP
ncbi:glycoside hydrolase family 31 protein [Leptolyngbya sp. FACHB-711]|uniref:glycoside hydrolase family 31 protein n=1 Tax=unclassified Leptolyngbya TaxID=2650499 RepID=UPI001688295E|nr:glycoside hydrolase family 31 protein [Leptolyngbya sp. FACHB-711]MBD1851489.1 glycoside hydrolase family 31 protein [Cyanobacteria bacterium FACHB-502]MBD2023110.1 glycoside hydrolase family 31 protein [Leptolyngbya sp. FACHB-711]